MLAAGTAALAISLSASSSAATAPGWHVSPGGSFTGSQSGKVTITDTVTKKTIVCATTAAAGRFRSGTGLPGAGIGTLGSVSLTGCAIVHGVAFTVTPGPLPWSLNASKYIPAKATTYGTLTKFHLTLAATGCSASIDGTGAASDNGTVVIHIHNSPSKLKLEALGSNLHIYVGSGCTGQFKNGDAATVSSAYLISPKQRISEAP
jgi:hypothetical protein